MTKEDRDEKDRLIRAEEGLKYTGKDLGRLESAINNVAKSVNDLSSNITKEIEDMRRDVSAIKQQRARDTGFIAGISFVVSLVVMIVGIIIDKKILP